MRTTALPPFAYIAAAISGLGGLLFGYDTGVISGAILFIRDDFALSATAVEVVVSCALVGALVGAMAAGTLADRFGRRPVILGAAALFVVGAMGTALAPTVSWLIVGRIVVGLAIGVASLATPLYISEVSPVAIRGRLVSINQLALTSGIVVSYLVDYALVDVRGWRWMFGLAAVPAATLGAGMWWLPESPRWLVGQNALDRAHAVLRRIQAAEDVGPEMARIQRSLGVRAGGWTEVFAPSVRPALVVGVGLAVFQQVTGINTVIYYAPIIFGYAGLASASASILATVGVGVVNVAMTVVALLLLDRVGRRPLLLAGLAAMIAGLGALGLAFRLPDVSGALGWIAAASLMIYVGGFALGLGPVFWLLIAEIYPLQVRGRAMSLATAFNWGANLLVAVTFLTLIGWAGRSLTFWMYGLVGIAAWLFAWFRVPETRGQSLEAIQAHFAAGRHPRALGAGADAAQR